MQFEQVNRDNYKLAGEYGSFAITPEFFYERHENTAKTEANGGQKVYDMVEAVKLHFAGDQNYKPVFRVDEMWQKIDGRVVTYAEKFQRQYNQFINNEAQIADGTPLENLIPYGMTQAQLSMCKASHVHSVEALAQLEGKALKSLSPVIQNDVKPIAIKYLEANRNKEDEVSRLRQELEALKAQVSGKPADTTDNEHESPEYLALREEYKSLTGSYPVGRKSSLETLQRLVEEAKNQ